MNLKIRVINDPNEIKQISNKSSKPDITLTRHLIMYFCRKYTRASLEYIAESVGRKHHTTAMHADKKIEDLLGMDWRFDKDYEELDQKIKHAMNPKPGQELNENLAVLSEVNNQL
jgi:hypothetical protein